MNKKQIAGLIAAAVVFVVVGTISTLLHFVLKSNFGEAWSFGLDYYNDSMDDGYEDYGYELPDEEYIGLVEVTGDIIAGGDYYYEYEEYYDHTWTLDYIGQLMDDSMNTGLLLYVDSAGGGVYESDELYLKLLEYKKETGRPVWTYMASSACSGGYYIAMASDKIYCNRNGLTGSIGVIMTLTDYTAFLQNMGIAEVNITSGENKSMGSSAEKMTQEQREIFQSIIDETYDQFVDVVASGRNLTREEVLAVGDGRVYTPKQALELNLIDEIATYDEMRAAFEAETGVEMIAASEGHRYADGDEAEEQRWIQAEQEADGLEDVRWYQDMKRWKQVGRPMYYAR